MLAAWEITWLAGGQKLTMTFPAPSPEEAIAVWRVEFEGDGVEFVALVRAADEPQ